MLKKIIPFILIIVLIGSCKKKYPEDTLWFHTHSPYQRLTRGEWNVKSYVPFYQGSEIPSVRDMTCSFNTNGTSIGGCGTMYSSSSTGIHERISYMFWFNGTWEFIDNDNKIKVTNDPTHITIWTIEELDRKNLKIKSDSVELTLN